MNLPALHFLKSLLNLNLFQRHPFFLFDLQIIIDNVLNLSIIMSKKKALSIDSFDCITTYILMVVLDQLPTVKRNWAYYT